MLQGKTVLLGVTGSIAAYKIAYLAKCTEEASCTGSCTDDKKCHKLYQSDHI